jgi:hypothetical protein
VDLAGYYANSSNFNYLQVLLDLKFADPAAHSERGAPSALQAELGCTSKGTIAYTVRWSLKGIKAAVSTLGPTVGLVGMVAFMSTRNHVCLHTR